MAKAEPKPTQNEELSDKQPKRAPLLQLARTDRKLSQFDMIRRRAAIRTTNRIKAELAEKELKREELRAARGEDLAEA